jgi:hypothetical protein
MGKEHPNFHGLYCGLAGKPIHKTWVDGCDLVLRFGPLNSDINQMYSSTALPNAQATVTIGKYCVKTCNTSKSFTDDRCVLIKSLLGKLLARLDKSMILDPEPYPETESQDGLSYIRLVLDFPFSMAEHSLLTFMNLVCLTWRPGIDLEVLQDQAFHLSKISRSDSNSD